MNVDHEDIAIQCICNLLTIVQAERQRTFEYLKSVEANFYEGKDNLFNGAFDGTAITIFLRNEGRSIEVSWRKNFVRAGKVIGRRAIRRRSKDLSYDHATLKRETPEHLHELVLDTERQLADARRYLRLLTEIELKARSEAARRGFNRSALPSTGAVRSKDSDTTDLDDFWASMFDPPSED